MARLRPEDLNLSALPRGPLGHLKAEAVSELLQHAAWDYREALAQNKRLAGTVEELTRRVEELTAEVVSLEEAAARRKDPDELARTLIAAAQRAAREEREAARLDAEAMLKKAARRADRIEQLQESSRSELARLESLREDVAARLRGLLEVIATRYGNNGQDGSLDGDGDGAVVRPGRER